MNLPIGTQVLHVNGDEWVPAPTSSIGGTPPEQFRVPVDGDPKVEAIEADPQMTAEKVWLRIYLAAVEGKQVLPESLADAGMQHFHLRFRS